MRLRQKYRRNNTAWIPFVPSSPKHYSRLSIIWIVPSIGVTSFRSASFFFCLSSGCPPIEIAVLAVFQNSRGICQFVPLDHRPPPTDLQLLHFPPPFHCLEYYRPFVYLLASLILYRVWSPFLLPLHKYPFNFFTIYLFSFFLFPSSFSLKF